jgi:anti-sigma-K factor RskA
MAPSPHCCPAGLEGIAENYCLGMLSAEDARAFEAQVIACTRCADTVQAADDYIRTMRCAARREDPVD